MHSDRFVHYWKKLVYWWERSIDQFRADVSRKEAIFALLLVLSGFATGVVCNQVARHYEKLFLPTSQILRSALWVFAALLLIALLIGLVSALLRPYYLLLSGNGLGAVALMLVWRGGWVSLLAGVTYFSLLALYTHLVVRELDQRLAFSFRPLAHEQRKLFFALALVVSISFASGYRQLVSLRGFAIPPEMRQSVEERLLAGYRAHIESRPGLSEEEKERFILETESGLAQVLDRFDETIRPYARYVPLGLVLPLLILLQGVLTSLGWIPILLMQLILPLLDRLGVTSVNVDIKERRRLRL